MNNNTRNIFPSLRCSMGDWIYYITYMRFNDIQQWIKPTKEVHRNKALHDMIQRQLTNRSSSIADYLIEQNERFFNAIVVGIYGGAPQWYPVEIGDNPLQGSLELDTDSRNAFGFLMFDGQENLFAIDGQHRVEGIKQALDKEVQDEKLKNDELTVILVAHGTDEQGLTRTRRLFSTLNRHAKPVSKGEIVSLDEDDAFAIVTRRLVENFELLRIDVQNNQTGIVRYAKTTPVPVSDQINLTSILALYDLVTMLYVPILDKGKRKEMGKLKIRRPSDATLDNIYNQQIEYWSLLRQNIPEYDELFSSNPQDKVASKYRTSLGGHLMFRPIGQKAFTKALRIMIDRDWKMEEAIQKLSAIPMQLSQPPWEYILWNPGTRRINTKVSSLLTESICLHYVGEEARRAKYDLLEEYRKVVGNPEAKLP